MKAALIVAAPLLPSVTATGPATLASGEPWHTEPPNVQEIIYAAEKQKRLYLDLLGAQDKYQALRSVNL